MHRKAHDKCTKLQYYVIFLHENARVLRRNHINGHGNHCPVSIQYSYHTNTFNTTYICKKMIEWKLVWMINCLSKLNQLFPNFRIKSLRWHFYSVFSIKFKFRIYLLFLCNFKIYALINSANNLHLARVTIKDCFYLCKLFEDLIKYSF